MKAIAKVVQIGAQSLGFDLVPRDSHWECRCPGCRARPSYSASDRAWVAHRLGKDVGFACDGCFVVGQRFVDWIEEEGVAGAILTQVGKDSYFLDAVQIEMDEEKSGLVRLGDVCSTCGLTKEAIMPPVDGVDRVLHDPIHNLS